jgi:nitric oxide reductase large subunit
MLGEERPSRSGSVALSRFLFGLMTVSLGVHCWIAARAIASIGVKFDVGVLWLLTVMMGGAIWLAPKRARMSGNLSSSLLCGLAFVMLSIGHLLIRLSDYVQMISSVGRVLR